MFFVNRQKKMEEQFYEYCKEVSCCLDVFKQSFEQYSLNNDCDILSDNACKLHKAESRADDIRRDIEVLMYSKSLFPESRGDILGLLETMDRMPNQAQTAVRMMLNQRVQVSPVFWPRVLEMVTVSHRCVHIVLDATAKLFKDYVNVAAMVGKIDELESETDHIEADLIRRIFASDMDGIDKLLFRDMVQHIESVSDRAQNVADRLRIIVAKRSV